MKKHVAIIGGGPSGLMAAETLANNGHDVTIYDRMPSFGRKFLMAGRGGLNLTHSEDLESFLPRYGTASEWLTPYIKSFTPIDLRNWCEGLGQETFIGSSGRVFPRSMKGAPLLRAWLLRLNELGAKYHTHHTWLGWKEGSLLFKNKNSEEVLVKPDATLLALGGASWPRLGSDGSWVSILSERDVKISELRPTNCGFIIGWSEYFSSRFAGMPLKPVALTHKAHSQQGEVMITSEGIEGGAVYALSSLLRQSIENNGSATLELDLRPDMTLRALVKKLEFPRGSQSFSNYLRKAGLSPLAISLLREAFPDQDLSKLPPHALALKLKTLPLKLIATKGIDRAISSAGGIRQESLDNNFMLKSIPGVFATGEMLDWEAPTGGYLLQACFSTSIAAANGILKYLNE